MEVEIRRFEPADYESLSEIFHSNYPEYQRSAEEFLKSDENWDGVKYVLRRWVAVEPEGGRAVAVGEYRHMRWMFHPRKFWFTVDVHSEWQRRGIGTEMYNHVEGELKDVQAVAMRTEVREDKPSSIAFLQAREFRESMRAWESRLRVREFDFDSFAEYTKKADSQGIAMSTLAEEIRTDPECYRKLHELVTRTGADVPRPDKYTPISFEDFRKELSHPSILPECWFIAKDKDRYVGMSDAEKSEKEPKDLYQGYTAVLPEYRSRGIAIALKLKVIEFAKQKDYEVIKTGNASTNVGMLHINEKLGFRRHVGWITFEKKLAE